MKRLAAALAVFILLIAVLVAAVPRFRLSLVGAGLAHRLQPGSSEDLVVASILSTGNEIRPLSEGAGVFLPGAATPESYDLRMTLEETVDSSGPEEVLRYRVREVRSEQLGTTGGEGLTGNVLVLRVRPEGLPVALSRRRGEPSRVLDDRLLAEILSSAWPGLPRGLVRPGSVWTGRFETPLNVPLLAPARVLLQYRLQYRLEGFHQEGSVNVARVLVRGEIVPRPDGEVPAAVQVGGTGRVEATVLVDVATGKAIIGDDRTASTLAVRFEDRGLEVVSFTDRRTRFWRPRVIPDGMQGFTDELPVPAETAVPATEPRQLPKGLE